MLLIITQVPSKRLKKEKYLQVTVEYINHV